MSRLLIAAIALILGFFSAAPLYAQSGGSQASCPLRADLAQGGIRLTREKAFMSVLLTRTANGVQEERTTRQNGNTKHVTSEYLHPLAVSKRTSGASVLSVEYATDTEALRSLDRLGTWQSDVTLRRGSQVLDTGTVIYEHLGKARYQVGKCTYKVWRVRETLALKTIKTNPNEKLFAPDPGIVLAFYALSPDGKKRLSGFEPNLIEMP